MQTDLPVFEWGLCCLPGHILKNELCCPSLGVLSIGDESMLVKLQDVREDRIGLFESAWFTKDARIIDSFEQRKANASIRDPERECPDRPTDGGTQARHGPRLYCTRKLNP
jgi:hypothetical protein